MDVKVIEPRRMDVLGRVLIPKNMRQQLGLGENSVVNMTLENGKIIIEPSNECCLFCGSDEDVIEFKGRRVCKKCLKEALEE